MRYTSARRIPNAERFLDSARGHRASRLLFSGDVLSVRARSLLSEVQRSYLNERPGMGK